MREVELKKLRHRDMVGPRVAGHESVSLRAKETIIQLHQLGLRAREIRERVGFQVQLSKIYKVISNWKERRGLSK